MLSRTAFSVFRRVAVRALSSEAAAAASTSVKLNFNLPHEAIYSGASVGQVILPGQEGEYGVTANHVPYVAQLKPGVMQVIHEDNPSEPEKYFVAGGYAFTHPNSTTDVVCPEAVKLDDLDSSLIASTYEAAKSAFSSAAAGSVEQAEAQIEMEVCKAMGSALGMNLN